MTNTLQKDILKLYAKELKDVNLALYQKLLPKAMGLEAKGLLPESGRERVNLAEYLGVTPQKVTNMVTQLRRLVAYHHGEERDNWDNPVDPTLYLVRRVRGYVRKYEGKVQSNPTSEPPENQGNHPEAPAPESPDQEPSAEDSNVPEDEGDTQVSPPGEVKKFPLPELDPVPADEVYDFGEDVCKMFMERCTLLEAENKRLKAFKEGVQALLYLLEPPR